MEVEGEKEKEETAKEVADQTAAQQTSAPRKQRVHINQNHKNPYLRISAPRDRETAAPKPPTEPAVTTFREGGFRLIVRQPTQTQTQTPYQLALDAVAKLKPIVVTRTVEKDQGLNAVETLNFSMLTNVETMVDSDRGAELEISRPKKRKPGRPPKRRDTNPGLVASPSQPQLLTIPQLQPLQQSERRRTRADAADQEESGGHDDKRLSNWFEGGDWSSEESEQEDEDLEAKMKREREAEERKSEAREKRKEKKAREREEFMLREAQKQEQTEENLLQGYEDAIDDGGNDPWGV